MGFIPSFYRKGYPTRTTWELKHCLSLARIVVRKLSWTRCLSGIQLSYFLGSLGQHWIMSEKTQMAPPSGDTEERQPASKIGWGKHSSLRVWGAMFLMNFRKYFPPCRIWESFPCLTWMSSWLQACLHKFDAERTFSDDALQHSFVVIVILAVFFKNNIFFHTQIKVIKVKCFTNWTA